MNIKRLVGLLCLIMFCFTVVAQTQFDGQDIYTVPELQASPVIGIGALNDLTSNFAKKHQSYGGKGSEKIYFVVKSNGNIGQVRIPPCKDFAIAENKIKDETQFIKSLRFVPAQNNGKNVDSWQYIMIPYWNSNPSKSPHLTMRVSDGPVKDFSENYIFEAVEELPIFPGGNYYLLQYLNTKIIRPIRDSFKNTSGRILIQFVVEKDGTISNIEVVKSLSSNIDSKVIDLIRSTMPRWFPGKINGKIVRSRYLQRIDF